MKLNSYTSLTKTITLRSVALMVMLTMNSVANAMLNFEIVETFEGVIVRASGSVDTSVLDLVDPSPTDTLGQGFIYEWHDALGVGSGGAEFYTVGAFSGPEAFGTGPDSISDPDGSWFGAFATTSTGDPIVFDIWNSYIVLPDGYVSGSIISGSAFYENETIESLALFDGDYSWTDEAGTEINLTIVPEPSAYTGIVGLGALFICCIRRTRLR